MNIENRLLLRLMTFISPFLGIVIFSYIVKFSHNIHVSERLPIYQGISSYFSLILIGFTYIKERHAITGNKIILPLIVAIIIPLIGYYLVHMDMVITILILTVSFLSSSILYLLLISKKMFYYLLFSISNSVFFPLTIIANYYFFVFLIAILFGILFYIFKMLKNNLEPFSYKNGGLDVLNSILLHSPYILLPFFDFMIQAAIGTKMYNDYVLINKYINGGITLLFSYKQLNLMFSGELKKIDIIITILVAILMFSTVGLFIDNWIVFAILIGLYSFGVNLSSLIVRSKLMTGISFMNSLIGVIFTIFYVLSMFLFKNEIQKNKHLFVFFMIVFTIIPSILLSFNYQKIIKTKI